MDELQIFVLALVTLLLLARALVDSKGGQAPLAVPVKIVSATVRRNRKG